MSGLADRVKLGGVMTVSAMLAVLVAAPDVPVMVTVAAPIAAVAAAVKVSVVLRVEDAGLKAAVTPEGNPLSEKLTAPVNPFCGVTVMVLVALAPAGRVRLAGEDESVKG